MRLQLEWDYLFWGIFIFALLFFDPLLEAVGARYTVLIICIGLIGLTIVKVTENFTKHKQCQCKDEDEEENDDA